MQFTKHCENKEIVAECISSVYEPVEEGWGLAISRLIPIVNLASDFVGLYKTHKVAKILEEPKMAKYIEKECDKVLKAEQKKDSSVSAKNTGSIWKKIISAFKVRDFNMNEVSPIENFKHWYAEYKTSNGDVASIKEYEIGVLYDTDHIQAIFVILYSADRNKYLLRRIPAPSNEELAKIFHKE